jgi:hypothetical protein
MRNSWLQTRSHRHHTAYLLSTALMAGTSTVQPMVELWAIDFDKGSFDGDLNWPCTPQSDLLFTFDTIAPVLSMIEIPHFFKAGATATSSVAATVDEYNAGTAQRWMPGQREVQRKYGQVPYLQIHVRDMQM